jgi:hypothetical protein
MEKGSIDITDDLDDDQFQELKKLAEEPAEKDTITQEEFEKMFAGWGTSSASE